MMLEIDGVRAAIQAHRPYEITDEISDTYLEVIDLATGGELDERGSAAFRAGRQSLRTEHIFIMHCLLDNKAAEDAYLSVLDQVDRIMHGRQLTPRG